jgi:Transmembrane secretion effector
MQAAGRDVAPTPRRVGGVLRQRDFRLLWIGETVSAVGNAMAVVGVPLLAVTVLKASTFAVSVLTAAAYVPWLVIGLPAGVWVDRLSCRPLMVACDIASMLLYASLPAAAWLGVLTTWQVGVVALLAGIANVFFATAYQVYLPSLVTAAELIEGNAKLQGSASAAGVGGRGAAGLAAQAVGAATALLFNAATFVVSAACLLLIRAEPARKPARAMATVRAEILGGSRFIARDPYLRPMTVYSTISNMAFGGVTALVVVFLVRVVGLGSTAVGLLMALGGIGGVVGALVVGRLAIRLGTARVLLFSALGAGMSGLLIAATRPGAGVAFYVIGWAVDAAGIAMGSIIAASFRQAYCPPSMLGRATASMRFLGFGSVPFGALAAGGLGTAFGIRSALWIILGTDALSGTILLTPAIRFRKNLPSEPEVSKPRPVS